MHFERNHNKVVLSGISSELSHRHLSQLKFWGFELSSADVYDYGGPLSKIFRKVVPYLEKNDLSFTFSEELQSELDLLGIAEKNFNEKKLVGKQFKHSTLETDVISSLYSFLENHIVRKLHDHQVKSFLHLALVERGANFSVPGAGKTSVVLAAYEYQRFLENVSALFVVGPPSCFGPWIEEFELVLGRPPRVKILAGGDKFDRKSNYFNWDDPFELYLTSFQTLTNDVQELSEFLASKLINVYFVIDEAHYIKRVDGNWADSILSIADIPKYKVVLTGTPMPRSYSDIYNLFDFLWPEVTPIQSSDKLRIAEFEKNQDAGAASDIIDDAIGPLFYRVRKSDLGLAPQIFNPPILIEMNSIERQLYDAVRSKIAQYAVEDYLQSIEVVQKLQKGRMMRLRQCASLASLLSSAIDDYSENIFDDMEDEISTLIRDYLSYETPAKIDALLDIVSRLASEKKKVVIWSNFLGTLDFIESTLKAKGYYMKKITGATPVQSEEIGDAETREAIRKEFSDPKSDLNILLANPAACSESISLHKSCNNAIYYDLSYNCAQYLQSLDRIHRVGGSENTAAHYYFLQYRDTIDESILESLRTKAERMFDVIEQDCPVYSLNMFDDGDELDAYNELFT